MAAAMGLVGIQEHQIDMAEDAVFVLRRVHVLGIFVGILLVDERIAPLDAVAGEYVQVNLLLGLQADSSQIHVLADRLRFLKRFGRGELEHSARLSAVQLAGAFEFEILILEFIDVPLEQDGVLHVFCVQLARVFPVGIHERDRSGRIAR